MLNFCMTILWLAMKLAGMQSDSQQPVAGRESEAVGSNEGQTAAFEQGSAEGADAGIARTLLQICQGFCQQW